MPAAGGTITASPDTIRAMSPELLFDYLGVRLNGEKAAGKKLPLDINFTDLKKSYADGRKRRAHLLRETGPEG